MDLIHSKFEKIEIHTAKCDRCGNNKITVHRCTICSRQLCEPCTHTKGENHYMHEGDKGFQGETAQRSAPKRVQRGEPSPTRRPRRNRRVVVEDDSEENEAAAFEPPSKRRKETHIRNPCEDDNVAAFAEASEKRTRGTHTRQSGEEDEAAGYEPPRKRRKDAHTRTSYEEDNEAAYVEPSRKRKRGTHTREPSEEDDDAARAGPSRERIKATHSRRRDANSTEVHTTTAQNTFHLNVSYFQPTSRLTKLNDPADVSTRRAPGRK